MAFRLTKRKQPMFLDVRYSLGLNNALEDREIKDVVLEDEDARNNGVQISVGLLF